MVAAAAAAPPPEASALAAAAAAGFESAANCSKRLCWQGQTTGRQRSAIKRGLIMHMCLNAAARYIPELRMCLLVYECHPVCQCVCVFVCTCACMCARVCVRRCVHPQPKPRPTCAP